MFRLITSANDNDNYLPYWPHVASAYKKLFPECKPVLAYIDDSAEKVEYLSQFGEVVYLKPVDGVPVGNQAKIARLFVAGTYGDDVCMINDVDLAPLQRRYYSDLLNGRAPDHLLCVGREVYDATPDRGKFPMSYVTGESYLFKALANEFSLDWEDFVYSYIGTRVFDDKEDPSSIVPVGQSDCFSDESLLRVLIAKSEIKVQHELRGWTDADSRTLCRARGWSKNELYNGRYVECHLPHPYCQATIDILVEYIL